MNENPPDRFGQKFARLDRTLLDTAAYPDETTLPVRFDDLDVQWHVNNASVVAMLQDARIRFTVALALPPSERSDLQTVVAGMIVEYAGEISYPGTVTISTGVVRIGTTSYTVAQRLEHAGRTCAYSLLTMVSSTSSGAATLPSEHRAILMSRAMARWE